VKKRRVVIVGCGIVGAMLAYELAQDPTLDLVVLDQQTSPAQGATGAALGVLVGISSHKVKGKPWRMRQLSMTRYPTLIDELEARLGRTIPFNRQGLLRLGFEPEALPRWQSLQSHRQKQGWRLEIWSPEQVQIHCPQLNPERIHFAIYSPQDAQVHPQALTLALVEAAQQQGVTFHWQTPIHDLAQLQSAWAADWLILCAGLGSALLTQASSQPLPMMPVLGQAMRVKLSAPPGNPDFQPVIDGDDTYIVPLGDGEYWLGATVEFPPDESMTDSATFPAQSDLLAQVKDNAIALCPALAPAQILETWVGFRPRPVGQAAPIIRPLAGLPQVILATGHYRNGILLAPATAAMVQAMIQGG
jgi:glycine oxidase